MRSISVKRFESSRQPLQYNCKNLSTGVTNTNTKYFYYLEKITLVNFHLYFEMISGILLNWGKNGRYMSSF